MFGAKKQDAVPDIPLLTIENYPDKNFDIIGLITTDYFSPQLLKRTTANDALPDMKKEAHRMGADAVIGIRIVQFNNAQAYAYGTAIKFK